MKKPLPYTKNQLIKKLKEDGNFNVEFVKELDIYSRYIWKRGGYDDLHSFYSQKGFDIQYNKILNTISEVLIGLDAKYDLSAKSDALNSLFHDIDYSNQWNKKALKALISNCIIGMDAHEINNIDIDEIKYTTDADEFISISVGASIWTYYVSGSITTQGKHSLLKIFHTTVKQTDFN